MFCSVGEDILPDIATINNIFLKTFNTSKSLKVREALYATLSVYVETLGACTGEKRHDGTKDTEFLSFEQRLIHLPLLPYSTD